METSRIDGTRSKVPGVYVSVYRSMYRSGRPHAVH